MMAWWLFYFVSQCGFTVFWVVLFLQARNGCPSVFLSFSAMSLCLCVWEESFWSVLPNSPALDKYYDGKGPGTEGWLDPSFLGFFALVLPLFLLRFSSVFLGFSSLFLLAFLSSCFCFAFFPVLGPQFFFVRLYLFLSLSFFFLSTVYVGFLLRFSPIPPLCASLLLLL
jgi:hypothetical protein